MKERSGMPYDVVAFSTDEAAMLLTLEEEGAFHRLIRHAWTNGSIPDDIEKLARICRCTSIRQMRRIWPAIEPLWPIDAANSARRINLKLEKERSFKQNLHKMAVQSGRNGGNQRWANKRNQKVTDRVPIATLKATLEKPDSSLPSPSHPIPNTNTVLPVSDTTRARSAQKPTAPPNEFKITEEMREVAKAEGHDEVAILRETAKMLDHFRAKGERKADWNATWRNWMRRSAEMARASPASSTKSQLPQSTAERSYESETQAKQRRTDEAAERLRARVVAKISSGVPGGIARGNTGDLSGNVLQLPDGEAGDGIPPDPG